MFEQTNTNWLVEVEVRPTAEIGLTELEQLVGKLSTDSAQLMAVRDQDSAAILVRGLDDWQLEQGVRLVESRLPGGVDIGPLLVNYRETINRMAVADCGPATGAGSGHQMTRVKLALEPLDVRSGIEFENRTAPSVIPDIFLPGVQRGIERVLKTGVLEGYPMIGIKSTLVDGAYDPVDSSVLSFEQASRAAFLEAALKANPVLLEPILKVSVVTPRDYVKDVLANLKSRRSLILGVDDRDEETTIRGEVAVALMFGYRNTLAHLAQGRASYAAQFSHYQAVRSPSDDDRPSPEPASRHT